MTIEQLHDLLADLDCHIVKDIECLCHQAVSYCARCKPVISIRTEHDPSVGIFGVTVSPWFHTDQELADWAGEHEAELTAAATGD